MGQDHETYLQDTPDFLRYIQQLNNGEDLPNNAILVVLDFIGLYDNIPPTEGVKCVGDGLTGRPNSKVLAELKKKGSFKSYWTTWCLSSMEKSTSRGLERPWEQSQPHHMQKDLWHKI